MKEVDADSPDETLEQLLICHDRVCREIGAMEDTDQFSKGHINGCCEARNRIEQTILEYVNNE